MTTSDTFYHKDYWGRALVSCVSLPHASKFKVYFFKKSCENVHKRYVFFLNWHLLHAKADNHYKA